MGDGWVLFVNRELKKIKNVSFERRERECQQVTYVICFLNTTFFLSLNKLRENPPKKKKIIRLIHPEFDVKYNLNKFILTPCKTHFKCQSVANVANLLLLTILLLLNSIIYDIENNVIFCHRCNENRLFIHKTFFFSIFCW